VVFSFSGALFLWGRIFFALYLLFESLMHLAADSLVSN